MIKTKFTVTSVEYPETWAMVVSAVRALSDPEYHWRVWVRRDYPHESFFDDFAVKINPLDDVRILDHPEDAIGDVLRRVRAMRRIEDAIEELLMRSARS